MKIDKIITMANKTVRLQFLAMERSLRSTGCTLPIWVIPFDNNTFELPEGSVWWKVDPLIEWATRNNIFSMCRKYQCFLTDNYQYVDADIIFLRNPQEVLDPIQGFVSSCTHWNNPDHTYNDQTLQYFKSISTTWQKSVFNAGQFACDRQLFKMEDLIETCEGKFKKTLIDQINIYKDQVAINLLVRISGVPVTNLTLPPFCMESTWAGDYKDEDFEDKYWKDESRKPYLAHWAGVPGYRNLAVNRYFKKHLTAEELQLWNAKVDRDKKINKKISIKTIRKSVQRLRLAMAIFIPTNTNNTD